MAFQLTPVRQVLHVEGRSEQVGEFAGTVVAIGIKDTDPIAATSIGAPNGSTEGLEGWGRTFFLVADENRPAPVWVAKTDVESHRVDDD